MYETIIGGDHDEREVVRVRYSEDHADYPVVLLEHLYVSEAGREFLESQIAIPPQYVDEVRVALWKVLEDEKRNMTFDEFTRRYLNERR